MILRAAWIAAGVLIACPAPAAAQVGVRAHVSYGSTSFEAAQSLDAVVGDSRTRGVTVGGSVERLWRGVFVEAAVGRRTMEGQRVFIHGGQVFGLGVPVSIEWRPIDLAIGWRAKAGRLAPYAGVGVTTIAFKETSAFAQAGDDVSEDARGLLVMAGLDLALTRWVSVGGELRHRSVDGVLGAGGTSQVYGETALGGTSVAVRVSVGR